MKQRISETEMVDLYIENLRHIEGDKIQIFREVRNRQKRIDIVEFTKRNHILGPGHAVEFKVFNWKKGFSQSLGNRVIMPYNSLAIWYDYEDKVKREELISEGIGLIIVHKDKNLIEIKPKKSKYLIYSSYKNIRERIKKIEN